MILTEKQSYFQTALANFTFDVASGGAIRHLADLGYTVTQITKRLDFPTPYDRVQQTVWEYFLQTGILRLGFMERAEISRKNRKRTGRLSDQTM